MLEPGRDLREDAIRAGPNRASKQDRAQPPGRAGPRRGRPPPPRPDDATASIRARLEALRAEDPWWDFALAEEPPVPARPVGPGGRWGRAVAGALALHLAAASLLLLLDHRGPSAPSPGAGAPVIDVMMLPAWPEKGHRPARLGAAAATRSARGPALISAPPRPAALAAAASEPLSAPVKARPPPPAETKAPPAPAVPAVQAAMAPRADTPPSTPSAAEALWEDDLLARLANLKRYPAAARRAHQQDTVMVRFVIDRTGQVLSAEVVKSKGIAVLDAEARALVRRAAPLPPPPAEVAGDAIQLIVPVQFILRRAT